MTVLLEGISQQSHLRFTLSSCLGPCKLDSFQIKLKHELLSRRVSEDTQPLMDIHSTGSVQSKPPGHIQHRYQVLCTNCFAY